MVNRKIRGTKTIEYNGIKFKSTTECSCYKKLEESGLTFAHESEKITLWQGLKPESVLSYSPKKLGKGRYARDLELNNKALINITYTPDFVVLKKDYKIYFDIKGYANDTYPIKKKMFLKYLEQKKDDKKYIFFEPHSIRQMLQAIEMIKKL